MIATAAININVAVTTAFWLAPPALSGNSNNAWAELTANTENVAVNFPIISEVDSDHSRPATKQKAAIETIMLITEKERVKKVPESSVLKFARLVILKTPTAKVVPRTFQSVLSKFPLNRTKIPTIALAMSELTTPIRKSRFNEALFKVFTCIIVTSISY